MGLKTVIKPSFWASYSKKLSQYIQKPRSVGTFTQEDADSCALRYVTGESGEINDGNWMCYYWLVDPNDGIVVDAKYQVYGESILIGLAEASSGLIVGKNYDQAARIHIEVIDHSLRDKNDVSAFPAEAISHVSLVTQAIKICSQKCMDIPISLTYDAPPVNSSPMEGEGYPGFDELSLSQKISIIDQVLDQEVRPYIEMDAGGVEVIGLQKNELTIAYQGTCTSCFSATGATLSFIQQVIQAKVDPKLKVIPNL
ncbi:MAG: hypothetical protein S4CHLAM6_03860 [Chlamydiae bacterium]|nr:hypothetical protein [Chlamydiota bacterium]